MEEVIFFFSQQFIQLLILILSFLYNDKIKRKDTIKVSLPKKNSSENGKKNIIVHAVMKAFLSIDLRVIFNRQKLFYVYFLNTCTCTHIVVSFIRKMSTFPFHKTEKVIPPYHWKVLSQGHADLKYPFSILKYKKMSNCFKGTIKMNI